MLQMVWMVLIGLQMWTDSILTPFPCLLRIWKERASYVAEVYPSQPLLKALIA